MPVSRLEHITKIGVEQMGELADRLNDPEVLRLENLDTDLRPPAVALERTRRAVDEDGANSYLPFFGLEELRRAAAGLVGRHSGREYDWSTQCIVTAGGLSGILNVLLATVEPGDEVLLTDPVYSGLINRVRLAGGVPRYVPLVPTPEGWRLDTEALAGIDPGPVRVVLMVSPSMPTGAVLNHEEWQAVAEFCRAADCLLVHDAAFQRILFDDVPLIDPASLAGMDERVVTVGSVSKEYRMIGWRVGWVVGPEQIVADTARVSITNVVCQTGIAMGAAAAAIDAADDGIAACCAEWRRRRDLLLEELADLAVIPPHGGWSMLVDVRPLGLDGAEASRRLLEAGKVAATPMVNWGSADAAGYVRLVYANEPCDRLRGIRARVASALSP